MKTPPTIAELSSMPGRDYMDEIKARMNIEPDWKLMTDPAIIERTRWALTTLIDSITEQKQRARQNGTLEQNWVRTVDRMRAIAIMRLDRLPWADRTTVRLSREEES